MVYIFLGLHIVLEEDLNFVVHLWPNVLQEQRGNDSATAKGERGESDFPAKCISH